MENLSQKELKMETPCSNRSLTEDMLAKHTGKTWWLEKLHSWSEKVDSYGVELKGIHRYLPEERHSGGTRQVFEMILLWLSGCGGLPSMSGYFLGPLIFDLSFQDSISSAIVGTFLGTLIAGYGSIMGPRSGLRQMVGSRFQFGWWPAKFIALLNILSLLGWSVVNCVFGGQILASVSGTHVPLEVGITIITVISFSIAIFGIRYVQIFESWFAIPVIITFSLLYIASGKHFDLSLPSVGDSRTVAANWLGFCSSCFGITGAWISIASDYYVQFPENTPKWKTFTLTTLAIFIPTIFVGILGIGIASAAVSSIPSWGVAYDDLGNGGLLDMAFSEWKAGGKVFVIILCISLISNNILNTYSLALSCQVWGRFFTRIPRYILSFVGAMIYFILSMAGRNKLSQILSNFLPMLTYWCIIYFCILLEENVLFRRHKLPGLNDGYDWSQWNNKSTLSRIGVSPALAFFCGIGGAVIGMCQSYYVGPLAKLVGDYGGDIGMWLAFGFTGLSYPVFRYVDQHYFPRKL